MVIICAQVSDLEGLRGYLGCLHGGLLTGESDKEKKGKAQIREMKMGHSYRFYKQYEIIWKYGKLYTNKCEKLDKMDKFL